MDFKCNKCGNEGAEAGKCTVCNEGDMMPKTEGGADAPAASPEAAE